MKADVLGPLQNIWYVMMMTRNLTLLLIASLLLTEAALSQGLPSGTYRGTRICSDGTIPTDELSKYPVFLSLKGDGTYSSLVNIYKRSDMPCSERTSGSYSYSSGVLTTTSEAYERCGDCEPNGASQPSRQVTKTDIDLIGNGFVLRLFTDYHEGGSCKPGQHMIVTFKKMSDTNDDLGLVCKPIEMF